MKICPKCNEEYDDRFDFCKWCGVSLVKKKNENCQRTIKSNAGVVQHSSNEIGNNVIIALLFFIILAGAGFGYYYFNNKVQNLESQVKQQRITIENNDKALERQKKKLDDVKETLSVTEMKNDFVITGIYHSSALTDGSYIYSAQNLVDGNISSCWSEGVYSFGIGESIVINFDKSYKIHGINIWNGYQKSSELFYKNSRPSSIRIITDLWYWDFHLEDRMGMQTFNFGIFDSTRSVKIVINDIYRGTKYTDTCISEISFF